MWDDSSYKYLPGLLDSFTDELSSVVLRDSKRSSSLRLSNGSTASEKRLSSPAPISAHIEDGPVLRPPPPKVEKQQSASEQVCLND